MSPWRPQGQELVAFERYMTLRKSGGNHCHVNVLPIPAAAAAGARKVRQMLISHQQAKELRDTAASLQSAWPKPTYP